ASLSITLDKPFVIGDFLTVGEYQGTVERIGLKTTRVRSLSGEQIVFSNADLLNSRVRNYKRMLERRAVFTLRVRYETPAEKLEAIPAMIQGIVESSGPTRFDRSHFKEYGEYGLVYETVYYMLVPDYNEYMDTQQKINLAVYRAFDAAGISFALPTQRLFLQEGVRPSAGPREGDMPVETH
ncbi:MAG TPA: mechanosensitive ion channel domain-containing protein, partial [Trueperaceae bacterium]